MRAQGNGLALALVISAILGVSSVCTAASADEIARTAQLLGIGINAEMAVAEVGAGSGETARAVAERIAPGGRLYATELDPEALAKLRKALSGLPNVTVLEAGIADTRLPDDCCDVIFMEAVYHHFSKPAQIDASLLRALRPGGRLVVIDFPPTIWLSPWTPDDVPANRGGHGIPAQILIDELTQAGFEAVSLDEHWSNGWLGQHYFAAVFRKPMRAGALPSHQERTSS